MPPAASSAFRIAVFLNVTDQPARDIIAGVGDYSRSHGPWQFKHVRRCADWDWQDLGDVPVDGVLAQISFAKRRSELAAMRRPIVNVANAGDLDPLPSVVADDFAVGRMAREHFAERGFLSLAFCGPWEFAFSRERFAGFRSNDPPPAFWLPDPHQMDELGASLRRRFLHWLCRLPKPLGLFAATDRYARLVIECCSDLKLAVPDDVAVLGVNNDPIECELTNLPVSSIQLDARRQGREAAALLHELLRGGEAPVNVRRTAPDKVVTRRSTDVLAVPDESVACALRYLRSHLTESISIDAVARHAGVARRSLEVRFRRHLGRSPYEELLRLRVNRAREELRIRERRISEVAERCGFGEARLLDLHFRRATGMTPTAYRRSLDSARAPRDRT